YSTNVALNGSTSTTATLSTTSATPISYSIASSATWLSVPASQVTGTVTSASPVTLSVILNALSLPSNTYTGTLTITQTGTPQSVQFQVTMVVGTGGTGITYNVSASTVNLNTVTGPVAQLVTVTSNNSAIQTFNATATSNTNWLLVNFSTF